VLEDAFASNGPIHGAITKRYLQQRSVIFRSSGEIFAAIGEALQGRANKRLRFVMV
jgi:hypothetical protein